MTPSRPSAHGREPECAGKATQAQVFDNLYVMRYFRCTNLCLLVRAIDFELERAEKRGFTPEQVATLKKAHEVGGGLSPRCGVRLAGGEHELPDAIPGAQAGDGAGRLRPAGGCSMYLPHP